MPLATTMGCMSSGHDDCAPVPCIEGSPTMFVEGQPVTRIGDSYAVHGCPAHPPHSGKLSTGSSVLFVDGRAVGRVGDTIGSGGCTSAHRVAEGKDVLNVVD